MFLSTTLAICYFTFGWFVGMIMGIRLNHRKLLILKGKVRVLAETVNQLKSARESQEYKPYYNSELFK